MKFYDSSKDFSKNPLRKNNLSSDPYDQMERWFNEAAQANVPDLNTMMLATASKSGKPSCRTVLLKSFDREGFVFFTNYQSRKAQEILENPFAMTVIYWQQQKRQICIEGKVEKISEEESYAYFSQRSRGSQIGAWTSQQGKIIESRDVLEQKLYRFTKEYEGKNIPLPDFWGGFRLIPERIEFWQAGRDRIHDRFSYKKGIGGWNIERLSP